MSVCLNIGAHGAKARAGRKGLKCTTRIFSLISRLNWYCWLQQPFLSFSVNLEQMVAFWQLKKIFQKASFILEIFFICCNSGAKGSVEFVSLFDGLFQLQIDRFDVLQCILFGVVRGKIHHTKPVLCKKKLVWI